MKGKGQCVRIAVELATYKKFPFTQKPTTQEPNIEALVHTPGKDQWEIVTFQRKNRTITSRASPPKHDPKGKEQKKTQVKASDAKSGKFTDSPITCSLFLHFRYY